MRDTSDFEKAVRDIICIAPHTEITRHSPGRIRLKYSLWGLMPARDIDFDNLVRRIPGLLNAQVKLLSRSIIIDYDPKLLPGDLWDELNRIKSKPELALRVAERLQGLLARNKTA